MENTLHINDIPENEERRLEVLKRYQILQTPPEKSFNNIAKLATQFFDLPIALITFVDTDNVFYKATEGIDGIITTPRNTSICSMSVLSDEVLIFEDITKINPETLTDPLIAAELGFKFYAGAPLVTPDGFRIGTICLLGREARTFSEKETSMLKGMAAIVMDEIELRLQGILEGERRLLSAVQQAQKNLNNQSIIANAPIALAILTGEKMVVESVNNKMLRIWGKTNEIIGQPLRLALPELEGLKYHALLAEVFETGISYYGTGESLRVTVDTILEEERFYDFIYHALKDDSDNTVSIMVIATEVTEQHMARQIVESREKQLGNIVMNSAVGLAILKGKELIVETVNQPLYDIWGLKAEEVIGKSLVELFPHLLDEHFRGELIGIFEHHESVSLTEIQISFPDGEGERDYFLDINYAPLFDDEGNVINIVATVNDITDVVRTRKFLEKVELEKEVSDELLIKAIQDLALANKDLLDTHQELKDSHERLQHIVNDLYDNQPNIRNKIIDAGEDLQHAGDNLRNAIETSKIGTWFVEIGTKDCNFSTGLKTLLGFHPDDDVSFESGYDVILDEYRQNVFDIGKEIISNGGVYKRDFPIRGFHDQQIRWVRSFGKVDYDESGKATHLSGVSFEIPAPIDGPDLA